MFRFCLIGYGRWGKVYYETIRRLEGCQVDCIVLNYPNEKHDTFPDATIFYDVETAIKAHAIDGVVIATPPSAHYALASTCLSNRIPVIVEKPFTVNHQEATLLDALAKRNNTFCMAGYQHLHSSGFRTIKETVASRDSSIVVYSEGIGNGPFRKDVSVFRDWGSHEFAIAIELFGEAPSECVVSRIAGEPRDFARGAYSMELRFGRGRIFCSVFGNLSLIKRRTLITAYDRGLQYFNGLDQGGCALLANEQIEKAASILTPGALPLDLMLRHFIDNARKKSYSSQSLITALSTARLLDEIEPHIQEEINYG